jgi:hypothetical protein
MRALKSVLVMAGALKRDKPGLPEDAVLIRAMRDANLPKLLPDDAALFGAIIGDLFPGVQVPQQQDQVLQAAVELCCRQAGLQPEPAFMTKVRAGGGAGSLWGPLGSPARESVCIRAAGGVVTACMRDAAPKPAAPHPAECTAGSATAADVHRALWRHAGRGCG